MRMSLIRRMRSSEMNRECMRDDGDDEDNNYDAVYVIIKLHQELRRERCTRTFANFTYPH